MRKQVDQQGKGTIGRILNDGTLIEMIYDPMFEKGNFAIKIEDQPVQVINKIQDPMTKVLYTPLIDNSVSTGHFLFPSEVHIWPETISTIFNRICSYIRKYIDIDEDCISIAASFAMMTHVYDRFEKVPYLRFFGPHGSGKSRALAIMRSICYHSINLGASQTAPNVFRALDSLGTGTLFLDEANFLDTSRTSDMTKILNDGYSRDGVVYRCDPRTNETKPYRVFSPKVLANHTSYDDPALESRMLTIHMKPSPRKDIPLYLPNLEYLPDAVEIRNTLLHYRLAHFYSINLEQKFEKLTVFDARAQEITLPLLWAQELDEVPDYLMRYLRNLQSSRKERQMLDEDAIVADIVSSLMANSRFSVTLTDVRSLVFNKGQIDLPFKRLGHYLRQFGATSIKSNQGYKFNLHSINTEFLKSRYGL